MSKKHTAIVLAAGKGSRMQSAVPKQYLELCGKPVLYYSLAAFEESFVDEIILVTGKDDISYCKEQIVERYGFQKITKIIDGGAERYLSVYQGLLAAEEADYVYIHDGARPFVDAAILSDAKACVEQYQACVAGMAVKDTIKIVDAEDFAKETPERKYVWQVQTPQVFSYALVREAYDMLMEDQDAYSVTDDAMVVETFTNQKVYLSEGSYENIKLTTPEDMTAAHGILSARTREL